MKKKFFSLVLAGIIGASMLMTGCSATSKSNDNPNDKIKVIATLFPQYDFARSILGDKGEVSMLLNPGVESHTYEPTPADIININKADLFVYTGEYMEPWAATIINSIDNKELSIVDASANVELEKEDEEDHDHEHEAAELSEEGHNHDEHEHEYNPHIWTSPINAKIMVDNILEGLQKVDPDNYDYYKANADEYKSKLDGLDTEIRDIVSNGKRKKIIFGDRFALQYFTEEYGLEWDAAFDSCSSETEPSAKVLSALINEVKEDNIPVVYYAELSNMKVADVICEETGAKPLLFHSCHNVTKDELKSGITYLDLMKQNVENLRIGVN